MDLSGPSSEAPIEIGVPAARHHFGIGASDLSRYQAASLAAALPAPPATAPGHGVVQRHPAADEPDGMVTALRADRAGDAMLSPHLPRARWYLCLGRRSLGCPRLVLILRVLISRSRDSGNRGTMIRMFGLRATMDEAGVAGEPTTGFTEPV